MLTLQVPGVRVAATSVVTPRPVPGAPEGRTGPVENLAILATRYKLDTPRGAAAAEHLLGDLRDRVGLLRRHHAHAPGTPFLDGEETSASLAARAAREALGDVTPGMLLCATSTPHRWTSTTAAATAALMGLEVPFMDVRMGCAAGTASLLHGALLVRATGKPVLVAAADTFSKAAPPSEALAAVALGDAGAACLLVPGDDGEGFVAGVLDAAPSLGNLMTTQGTLPPAADAISDGAYFLSGDPDAMGQASIAKYATVLRALLDGRGAPDLVLLHQTQRPILTRVLDDAGLDHARALSWLADYANTGTANVLIGLHLARQDARWKPGAEIVMAAVGGGLAAAGARYRVGDG